MAKVKENIVYREAQLLSEAISELGFNTTPQALVDRVRQLQIGQPSEDEFALLLGWLGRCSLVHKLDQLQVPPASPAIYRVPDLLAIFRYKEREIPVLIEIKTTADHKLSWRPDYYEALTRYARLLNMPLLLAWNFCGFWALCDTNLFDRPNKNYHLTFETAVCNSLMCELAGDFFYVFQPGVGVHLRFHKIEKLPPRNPPAETWHLRVEDAYFTDGNASRLSTFGQGIWVLFLGTHQETETQEHEEYLNHSFIITEESPMQAAHRLLPLVTIGIGATESVPWRKLMEDCSFTIRADVLADEAAADSNIVQYLLRQQPSEMPSFLR